METLLSQGKCKQTCYKQLVDSIGQSSSIVGSVKSYYYIRLDNPLIVGQFIRVV